MQHHRAAGNRVCIGNALASIGELHVLQARPREALEVLREGEAVLREIGNPLELAGLLCVKGRAAIAAGEPKVARGALEEAEAIAGRLAATPNASLAQDIKALRLTGATSFVEPITIDLILFIPAIMQKNGEK